MRPSAQALPSDIERARLACDEGRWRTAYECLVKADAAAELGADDLWLLGISAYLIGRTDAFVTALERAHRLHLDAADCGGAVRCAFWIAFHLAESGEGARAAGWLGRASRILEQTGSECAERGYLRVADGHSRFTAGDTAGAFDAGGEAARLGEQFGDRDLVALAVHLQGRARLAAGATAEGFALLDEAMVAVSADALSPQLTGLIYCSVIGACRSVYALSRAQEWTAALSTWCERQPDMVAYTGECRLYRAELMQLQGDWQQALQEAREAVADAAEANAAVAASAHYQAGEVHRLLGEFAAAEAAFRAASQAGREPQPGLALLRHAQGDVSAAAASIRRTLAETDAPLRRVRLLPAAVEILLAADAPDEASRAASELAELAVTCDSRFLDALAAHALGAVALAGGEPEEALRCLRRAWKAWHELNVPFEAARVRMLLGLACRTLGDEDAANLEIAAARVELERLGAAPGTGFGGPNTRDPARSRHGLTPRELQVIALIATGQTNRDIAAALFLSERTVARHVSNIFRKLGLTSRAAATAYAYEHQLLTPPA